MLFSQSAIAASRSTATAIDIKRQRWKNARQALFNHMARTHNLHLLESEMDEIERLCAAIAEASKGAP
jgi:hypothetical protein